MEISLFNVLPYYSHSLLYLIFYTVCVYFKNPYIGLWIIFGLFPFLDQIIPYDLQNPTKEEQKLLKNMIRFKIPLFVAITLDWVFLFWSINEILKNENGFVYNLGLLFLIILFEGISINTSHELNHKISPLQQIFGTLSLSKNFYMHFLIEHNQGHHKIVATPEDPATARFNESLYQFLPRSIIMSYLSSWKLENKICQENYNSAFTYKNRMIYFTLAFFILPLIFFYIFGLMGMVLQIIIGIGSFHMLEIVNYIEHYGLERKKLEDGKYENVNNTHSWNAPHRLTNYILFKLQRHSDHHDNALKPYQNLCTYEKSPLLPNGYALCVILATVPSKWFEIMNPMVKYYKEGQTPSKEYLEKVQQKLNNFILKLNFLFSSLVFLQIGVNRLF